MNNKRKTWYTCTPVPFHGDITFFARDSGLLCKGFQKIGVHCKAIMPYPAKEGDCVDDLIRTDYKNLENPEWWKQLNAEGVVLYAWGLGRYRNISRAIHKAGITLVANMDSSGNLGIVSGLVDFFGITSRLSRQKYGSTLKREIFRLLQIMYGFLIAPLRIDFLRAMNLRNADLIGCVTPLATEKIRRACILYGGHKLASKVTFIPHPVADYMYYDHSVLKTQTVVSVGRWGDLVQKDPALLVKLIDKVCSAHTKVVFKIIGSFSSESLLLFKEVSAKYEDRVKLLGMIPNLDLRRILMESQILVCSSSFESFHIASGEALCCGCSIIGPNLPEIPSMRYFACNPHGRACERSDDALATALIDELKDWETGLRNPKEISDLWCSRLHSTKIASKIIQISERLIK